MAFKMNFFKFQNHKNKGGAQQLLFSAKKCKIINCYEKKD